MTALPGSLRARVFKAGGYSALGYGATQLLRFASNLVLTRLLYPEAFGLMAIVGAVLVGVTMLSDVGVSQSIVRSANGTDTDFLNTAWTIQLAKGVVVALLMCLGARPLAAAYGQPLIAQLLPVMALVALISGFASTKVALANRNVDALRVTWIDVGSLALSLVVAMLLAYRDPSPWALVWGNVVGAIVKVAAGHALLHGPGNRLRWNRDAARQILSFGSWVLLSSSLTFLVGEGNKLIAAALMSVHLLALTSLAGTLNMTFSMAILYVASRVLFPAYAEMLRNNPERFARTVSRARLAQIVPIWLVAAALTLAGSQIVDLLYDDRYKDAGLILQMQAASILVGVLTNAYTGVLFAMGRVGLSAVLTGVQVLMQWLFMLIGNHWFGPVGVVAGNSLAGWLLYPVTVLMFGRLGLWFPRVDFAFLVGSVVVAAVAALQADWQVAQHWSGR